MINKPKTPFKLSYCKGNLETSLLYMYLIEVCKVKLEISSVRN